MSVLFIIKLLTIFTVHNSLTYSCIFCLTLQTLVSNIVLTWSTSKYWCILCSSNFEPQGWGYKFTYYLFELNSSSWNTSPMASPENSLLLFITYLHFKFTGNISFCIVLYLLYCMLMYHWYTLTINSLKRWKQTFLPNSKVQAF